MLNGRLLVPVFQGPLAFGSDHAIGPGIEEVLSNRWAFFISFLGHNAVNERDGIQFQFKGMGQKDRPKGFSMLFDWFLALLGLLKLGPDGFRGTKVLLPLNLDFTLDPMGFPQVPVGSTLGHFLVEVRHETNIQDIGSTCQGYFL